MKKFLVVLLILAVAGSLFAQELKLTGDFRSGLVFHAEDGENTDGDSIKPAIGVYSPAVDSPWRLTLEGRYSNEPGTAGVYFNLRSRGNNTDANSNETGFSTYAVNPYAWFKLLDKKITFYIGAMDFGQYNTGGGVDWDANVGEGRGLLAEFAPIDNLLIGVRVHPNYRWNSPGGLGLEYGGYSFGITYRVPDMVKVIADVGTDTNQVTLTSGGTGTKYNSEVNAMLGLQVEALKSAGLSTLNFDFFLRNIGGKDIWLADNTNQGELNGMIMAAGEKLAFTQGDLEVGGRFIQAFKTGKIKDGGTYTNDLLFSIYAQYKLNENRIIPRLDLAYDIGTSTIAGNPREGIGDRWKAGSRDANGTVGFTKDAANLVVYPHVLFQLGGSSTSTIRVGYTLGFDMSKDAGKEKITAGGVTYKPSTMDHAIFVDYKVSF